ncbi:MAG: hypothetical protein AAB335_01790 [candidate division NC10 bacterium]
MLPRDGRQVRLAAPLLEESTRIRAPSNSREVRSRAFRSVRRTFTPVRKRFMVRRADNPRQP